MLKVVLIVWACAAPNYLHCEQLMATEIRREEDPMRWCLLQRPGVASMWQLRLNDGWLTFTECRFVNPEKNGRKG